MALDAFRAPGGHLQGTATQAMLNASLRSRNAADGCPPSKPFGQPPLTAQLCVVATSKYRKVRLRSRALICLQVVGCASEIITRTGSYLYPDFQKEFKLGKY